MAAPCNGGVAAACSDSDDHIRQVALTVAVNVLVIILGF